jgi:hypothetical protein
MALVVSTISVILIIGGVVAGQNRGIDEQRKLAKVLARNADSISSVKVDRCRMSFKRSQPTPIDARQATSYVGGGFPSDESSGYLSSGADRTSLSRRIRERIEIDLSTIDPAGISVKPSVRQKGRNLIWLASQPDMKGIIVTPKQPFVNNGIGFVVNQKKADGIVGALKTAISACRGT